MFDISKAVRPYILDVLPYTSARDEFKGLADIFLDANENPFSSLDEMGKNINRYPDPLQKKLREEISNEKGIPVDWIFVGNGSDEAISLCIQLCCTPDKDSILITPPTYGMYEVSAKIQGVEVQRVPLDSSFQCKPKEVLAAIHQNTKLIFLCSPNNPTGNLLEESSVLEIVSKANIPVVVDEAYIDFASEQSLLKILDKHPNLILLQTFSKAWGLASLRIGMAFAHPLWISYLQKIKPPYNVNGLSQELALKAMKNKEKIFEGVNTLIEERTKLLRDLNALNFVEKVYPSEANFLLVQMHNATEVYQALIQKGIVVRNRSQLLQTKNCLRISIGSPEENRILIEVLQTLYN